MNHSKIEKGIQLILEGIGEDISRPGLADTPRRFAEMCEEIFSGLRSEPKLEVGFLEEKSSEEVIILRNLSFYSMCEHHLLPFFGVVHIAYIPQNNMVAGFSSIAKFVDLFARRPQIQERFTNQIADNLMQSVKPRGVIVISEAVQLCLSMRGTRKEQAKTIIKAIRGDISKDILKELK